MLVIGWVYAWWFWLTQVTEEIIDKVRKIWYGPPTDIPTNLMFFALGSYCKKSFMVWNESVNSEDQQFHQYQQSKQSSVTSTHWTQKKPMTYDIGNPGPGLEQAQKSVGIKQGWYFLKIRRLYIAICFLSLGQAVYLVQPIWHYSVSSNPQVREARFYFYTNTI